ncbi:MAG: UDP-3-O-(3-hydroxymyristoyl)glucosamine N-acyltransferase [Acidobacteria bacterium]|nr:UDP-3-O-(3-hydroxymyristoyl)glucosamine N-acyltransferase [Acidobacteriota bacterium]
MEKTVQDLARWLGGEPEGELSKVLSGVGSLESAGEGDVSFLESERNVAQAMASRAGCLLAPPGAALPGRTVIRVRHPRYAAAHAIELFHPPPPRTPGIHPTALIGKNAKMGPDVEIGPLVVIGQEAQVGARTAVGAGCVIGEGVILGEDCVLYPRVTLYPGVRLGSRVILHSGCVIGSDGFGYVFEEGRYHKFPQVGTVEIADDVEIGANTTVDRAALGATRIGRGTKIDNLVQVGHNVQIGENCVIAAQVGISGSAVIEDNVVIAGQVGIGDHARVEKGAVLGGQCGILPHKVVRAGQTVWGTPARPIKEHLEQQALVARLPRLVQQVNSLGERRASEVAGAEKESGEGLPNKKKR